MVQSKGHYPIKELLEHLVVFSNMADIDFYQEDLDDTSDSCLDDTGGIDEDCYGPDDHLSPLQKLEKYMNCDNVFSRQMVAKSMLDTLRAVGGEREECDAVLKAMVRLSDDAEATVRSELMEQVPHVAMYCIENKHIFPNSVPTYILPMVVKYLNDMNNQVRKTSQAALLVVLEQELVEKQDIEEQVVGVISDLARPDSPDDFKTEAVALMSKLAPLLGREITESQFLSRFCEMCTDNFFHVRKVCAANFGEICTVVSPESVEDQLLPKFYFLCEDGVWGVRKACAECFMVVSRCCTSETRRSQLSTIFVNLLCDMSRWVRVAAFQALGPFISTYADPRIMELLIQEGITSVEGEITCDINSGLVNIGEAGQGDNETLENRSQDSSSLTPGGETPEGLGDDDMELDAVCDTNNDNIITISDVTTDSSTTDSELSLEEKRYELYKQNNDNTCSDIVDVQHSELSEESSKSEVISESIKDTDQVDEYKDNAGESPNSDSSSNICDTQSEFKVVDVDSSNKTDDEKDQDSSVLMDCPQSVSNAVTTESTKDGHVHIHVDNVANYNAFQFWRTPIPQVDLDLDAINGAPANIHITAKVNDEEHQKIYATELDVSVSNQNNSGEHGSSVSRLEFNKEFTMSLPGSPSLSAVPNFDNNKSEITLHTASVSTINETSETLSNISSYMVGHTIKSLSLNDQSPQEHVRSNLNYMDSDSVSSTGSSMKDSNMFEDSLLSQQQDVIPPHLLEQYLSMADPTRAQTVDSEITRHCAYSLPAVAFTLGRKNWPCLKILYETLAADMQWKVRRTLAFSIHELALIVGEEITHQDLVPVFDGFLKDLDEVREGVLKHLSDFLRLLRPEVRRSYLPRVQDFLTTDNQKNWRFRMELAEQLVYLCELFTGHQICEHLVPIGMSLVGDRVAAVRHISCKLLAVMMRRLSLDEDERMVNILVNEITQRFALSSKWHGRQLYAQLCLALLEESSLSPVDFANLLLPSLLDLTTDNIPNVRISLAKTLSRTVIPSDYFTSYQNPHHDELLRSIQSLKSDFDKDVRYFSSMTFDLTDDCTDNIPV